MPRRAELSRRTALLGSLAVAWPGRASAVPPEVRAELPGAMLVGSGRLRWFGLSVYDIRLWSPQRVHSTYAELPLALELEYQQALAGRLIAQRSIAEMRRVGPFDDAQAQSWQAALERLLPDVAAGDRITGVQRPRESARLFVNGDLAGELRDPAFVPLFFGIWLAPQTSQPRLRAALLGA